MPNPMNNVQCYCKNRTMPGISRLHLIMALSSYRTDGIKVSLFLSRLKSHINCGLALVGCLVIAVNW